MAYLSLNPTNSHEELVFRIIKDDDGAHVVDLLKLLKVTGAAENSQGEQVMKSLYAQTEDFWQHYQDFVSRL